MFNNLQLYYLQQIGITPWVDKNYAYSIVPKNEEAIKCLIITPKLTSKECSLLENILLHINYAEHDLKHIELDELGSITLPVKAQLIISFGFSKELLHANKDNSKLVVFPSLHDLLQSSLFKKDLFHQLNAVVDDIQ